MSTTPHIKTEHNGAKNSRGYWGRCLKVRAVFKYLRRRNGKKQVRQELDTVQKDNTDTLPPLIDDDGELRELTEAELKRMSPLCEVDPELYEIATRHQHSSTLPKP